MSNIDVSISMVDIHVRRLGLDMTVKARENRGMTSR